MTHAVLLLAALQGAHPSSAVPLTQTRASSQSLTAAGPAPLCSWPLCRCARTAAVMILRWGAGGQGRCPLVPLPYLTVC